MNNNFEFKDWSGFRPLSGSYISQLGHLFIGAEMGGGFRPLSGSYISQSSSVYSEKAAQPVSVPYRGATFLNAQGHVLSAYRRKLFPSPIGELHFSIISFFSFHFSVMWVFPSPIGELHFSILYYWYWKHPRSIVSVPYRGATFLNAFITHIAIMMMVSVPYRGATFLNCGMNATIIYYNGFPSPIGELHFSIEFGIMDEWIRYVSVPYRGATFLNSRHIYTHIHRI